MELNNHEIIKELREIGPIYKDQLEEVIELILRGRG